MAPYSAHGILEAVECNSEEYHVFTSFLDDRSISSVCYIFGIMFSGRQFFPREGIRQAKKMLDVTFTVNIMEINIHLLIYG
jgi:hypothetical protein